MAAERWQRVEEIFRAAIELPAEQQAPFLDDSCGGDADLRQTVERLLNCDRQAGEFLEEALLGGIELVEGSGEATETIGPYRLIERTGSGGMGAVYRAARADSEYDQVVAIKVIHTGMGSPLAVERFRRERQILASLQHPNIARLLDGGTTATGLPYLVMEYIEGEPIDQYCDRLKLTLRERLHLFVTVCTAVYSAHQNLVVHRDLKPSNILVTAEGTVKLLDFGIAKLLSSTDGDNLTEATLTLERALTPSYASPEQIRGDLVTTASDVYSLGVLLFELMAGRKPFDLSDVTRREAERRILEDPAPPPSSTLVARRAETDKGKSTSKKSIEVIAGQRNLRPEALRRQLTGDIDTIVLTALRKDRTHRYPSVDKLAQDVRHHLDGLPIEARPPTFSYRAAKFLRRNRVAVAVAAAFALLVGGFSLVLSDRAERARVERQRTQQVIDLVGGLVRYADPARSRGTTITTQEYLDRVTASVGQELSDQPGIRADMLEEIGLVYLRLGLTQRARQQFEEALTIRTAEGGERAAGLSQTYNRLGSVAFQNGEFPLAETLHREALSRIGRGKLESPMDEATIINDLALAIYEQGRPTEAEPLFRQALALLYASGSDYRWVAGILGNLARLLSDLGEFEEAEEMLAEALAIDQRIYGEVSTAVAQDLNLMGFVADEQGDFEVAAQHHRRALELRRRLLSPAHPDLLESLNNVATTVSRLGDLAAAEPLAREAVETWERTREREHPTFARYLANLAAILRRMGRYEEAIPLATEALEIRRKSPGTNPRAIIGNLVNLGTLRYSVGDLEEAASFYRQAIRDVREGQTASEYLGTALLGLGTVQRAQGNFAAAESSLNDALKVYGEELGDRHPLYALGLTRLGMALSRAGRSEEAETALRRATTIYAERQPEHPGYGNVMAYLAEHLARIGRGEEAETLARQALAQLEGLSADTTAEAATARGILGSCLALQGRFAEAERLLTESLRQLQDSKGANHPDTTEARNRLTSFHDGRRRGSRAARVSER